MIKKYYKKGNIVYQVADDSGIFYLYKMKPSSAIVSEYKAWNFIKRYSNFNDCFNDLSIYITVRDIDSLNKLEIEEDKILSMIRDFKFYNS